MVKIYTKTGDLGTTSLFGGQMVNKDSMRLVAYGTVDEINSLIGTVLADFGGVQPLLGVRPLNVKLLRIQSELFVLGADLATPIEIKAKVPRIKKSMITRLEKEIDMWIKDLPEIKNFILPGGGKAGAQLHLARTIARRTEREIVKLSKKEKINVNILPYINRFSDWLFVLARYVNHLEKIAETYWKGR